MGAAGPGASARSRLVGTPPKAVSFGVPPLALELGPVELEIDGAPVQAAASVRLYDFGIAVLSLRVAVQDLPWSGFSRLVNKTDLAVGPAAPTGIWEMLLTQLRGLLGEALDRPTTAQVQEDYLMAMVYAFDQPVTAEALQERADLVPLLSGEEQPLSEGARRDLLRHRYSYHPDDLAVITWDRAFIYEPQREADVADVLEMANAQLLEMRAYDEMLDDELPRMRALVEAARRRANLLAARRYARLARRLLYAGGRGDAVGRAGGQRAAGDRGRVSGAGLCGGDGAVSRAQRQRRGGPQAGHHPRYLYRAAQRGGRGADGVAGNRHPGTDRGGDRAVAAAALTGPFGASPGLEPLTGRGRPWG